MKKLLAVLLCIVMMLSLVACGGDEDRDETPDNVGNNAQIGENNNENTEESTEETTLPAEPTAEDWEAIDQYRLLLKELEGYESNQEIWLDYEDLGIESEKTGVKGVEALGICYELISKLDAVDKWVGTDYIDEKYDRQSILDRFVVVKDVLLTEKHTHEDHVGNTENGREREWDYNADGTLRSSPGSYITRDEHPWMSRSLLEQIASNPTCVSDGRSYYVYDANGRIEKIEYKYGEDSEINDVSKYTYDGDLITEESILTADGREDTVSYTYNSNGQLTEMTAIQGNVGWRVKYVYAYEYNDQGQVAKETVTIDQEDYYNKNSYEFYGLSVITYTYDANGFLSTATCKYTENWNRSTATTTDEITYTCDDQGRVVSVKIDCGHVIQDDTGEVVWKEDQPVYNAAITYGNYYIYNIPVAAE